jgi:hypothetical protein
MFCLAVSDLESMGSYVNCCPSFSSLPHTFLIQVVEELMEDPNGCVALAGIAPALPSEFMQQ